jgi:ABC-type transport system substrate-binding protein
VISPWRTTQGRNTATWVLERNPYYFGVDTEGNQLPYVDKVVLTLGENLEVINLRAIAGEYDWGERHLDLQKLPVFIENQQKGDRQEGSGLWVTSCRWHGQAVKPPLVGRNRWRRRRGV